MVSSQIVEIIIKVKDEMSKNLEKIDKQLDKLGDTTKQVNNNTKTGSTQVTQALSLQERAIQKMFVTILKHQ